MLSLQGRRRRRRRPQRREREPGGRQGGERAARGRAGRLHPVLAARRRAALGSDGLSHALRAPGWAGRAAGREDLLHGPEERHVPGPLPTFPGDPHGGLRPQPTGEGRCRARGKGTAPADLGLGSGSPGKERVICPAWMGEGCLRDPLFSRVNDRWTIGVGLRSCGAEMGAGGMPVSLASRSPPRPGPCCWGTGSSGLTAGLLMGAGGNPGLEKRSWREAGERIRRGRRRRARLGALAGVGGVGVVLGDGREDGQRALPTGLRRLRRWLSKVGKGSALGGPPLVTWSPSLAWMFPSPQHPHWLTPPPCPKGWEPPKFGKLDGCQLTVLEGRKLFYLGEGLCLLPLSLFLCPWVTPR